MQDPMDSSLDLDERIRVRHGYGLHSWVFAPPQQPKPDTREYARHRSIHHKEI
jgi:hypothetical protein